MAVELTVMCLGPARDVFGGDRTVVAVPDTAIVADVIDALLAACPAAAELLPTCAVAVGDDIVGRDHPVHADDAVALLPPVAGG